MYSLIIALILIALIVLVLVIENIPRVRAVQVEARHTRPKTRF